MKNCLRTCSLLAVIGLAGTLAGCVTRQDSLALSPTRDFEIVETATKRTLTAHEMAQLREMVREYLDKQGSTESADYYLKVFFAVPEGAAEEWVIVRFSRTGGYTATRFSTLAAYPTYYDDPWSYYSYDYYPYSPFGFSRFSLQYYDYPYAGGYPYYPRTKPHRTYTGYNGQPHHQDGGNDRDHGKDKRPDHPGSVPGYPVASDYQPNSHPPYGNRPRREGSGANTNGSQPGGSSPDRYNTRQPWRTRTATPADYTPSANPKPRSSYIPQTGSGGPSTPRVNPSARDGDGSRYNRSRSDQNPQANPHTYNRSQAENSSRTNSDDNSQRGNYSQPATAPAYSAPPTRSDPPSYREPAARSDPAPVYPSRAEKNSEGRVLE